MNSFSRIQLLQLVHFAYRYPIYFRCHNLVLVEIYLFIILLFFEAFVCYFKFLTCRLYITNERCYILYNNNINSNINNYRYVYLLYTYSSYKQRPGPSKKQEKINSFKNKYPYFKNSKQCSHFQSYQSYLGKKHFHV